MGAFTGFLATYLSNFDQMSCIIGYSGAATLSLAGFAWVKLSWAREKRKLLKDIAALYDDTEKNLMVSEKHDTNPFPFFQLFLLIISS